MADWSEQVSLDFREFGTVVTGGGGGSSAGRRGTASRLQIVFYGELHCFRRFLRVLIESDIIFARTAVALLR